MTPVVLGNLGDKTNIAAHKVFALGRKAGRKISGAVRSNSMDESDSQNETVTVSPSVPRAGPTIVEEQVQQKPSTFIPTSSQNKPSGNSPQSTSEKRKSGAFKKFMEKMSGEPDMTTRPSLEEQGRSPSDTSLRKTSGMSSFLSKITSTDSTSSRPTITPIAETHTQGVDGEGAAESGGLVGLKAKAFFNKLSQGDAMGATKESRIRSEKAQRQFFSSVNHPSSSNEEASAYYPGLNTPQQPSTATTTAPSSNPSAMSQSKSHSTDPEFEQKVNSMRQLLPHIDSGLLSQCLVDADYDEARAVGIAVMKSAKS